MFLRAKRLKRGSAPPNLNLATRWQCKGEETWPTVAPDEDATMCWKQNVTERDVTEYTDLFRGRVSGQTWEPGVP